MNQRNDSGSAMGLIIGLIVVALLGIGAYLFLTQDEDPLSEDDTVLPSGQDEDVIQDPIVDTNQTNETEETEEDNLITIEENLDAGNIDAVVGVAFAGESAVVTDNISDRLFLISSIDQKGGDGLLMYLDDTVETTIAVGDEITVSGTFVEDLEGNTLDADESSAVTAQQAVLLATDVEVQN